MIAGAACTKTVYRDRPVATSSKQAHMTTPATPSPTMKPDVEKDLRPGEARLMGNWDVRMKTTNNSFGSKPHRSQHSWIFTPVCKSGACDVILHATIEIGTAARGKAGAKDKVKTRLVYLNGGYRGSVTGKYASCGQSAVSDTWSFSIRPTDGKWRGDNWVATSWNGTFTRDSPSSAGCRGSQLRAVIEGH